MTRNLHCLLSRPFCNVGLLKLVPHCLVVCASATVRCARGVHMIGWRATSAHDSLTYLAAK